MSIHGFMLDANCLPVTVKNVHASTKLIKFVIRGIARYRGISRDLLDLLTSVAKVFWEPTVKI